MSNLDKEFGGEQDGADESFKRSRQKHNEGLALEREKWQRERDRHEIRCIVLNAARMDLLRARGAEEIAAQANYVADLIYPDPGTTPKRPTMLPPAEENE